MNETEFYEQPRTAPREDSGPQGKPVKAIVTGLLIDILGGYILQTLVGIVISSFFIFSFGPDAGAPEQSFQIGRFTVLIFGTVFIGRLLVSILAGFVCAQISLIRIQRDATILMVISGGLTLAFGIMTRSPLLATLSTGATVAALAYGAWLGARRLRTKVSGSPDS